MSLTRSKVSSQGAPGSRQTSMVEENSLEASNRGPGRGATRGSNRGSNRGSIRESLASNEISAEVDEVSGYFMIQNLK